ncbi:MAG TPA: TetR-like C-terminal domain-containing protein [Candidatus Deferrimicrobium sp.]|nr:TetR-like C-terminal domain-containing protein [Candidatus Deferrimicrobium sp.]
MPNRAAARVLPADEPTPLSLASGRSSAARAARSNDASPATGGPVPAAPVPEPRRVGRPRSGTADRAILDAALALLSEVGLVGLTMSAVISRSRVARATVYRRYPTRDALLYAALAQVKGREPFALTGDLEVDIATTATWAAAVLAEARFQRFLPLFVAESLRGPAAARSVVERVAPNHAGIADEYRELGAATGLRTDIDPTIVGDILLGSMLMRLLSSGLPPDQTMIHQTVDVVLRGLRDPADPPSEPAGG